MRIALAFILALVACDGGDSEDTDAPSTGETSTTAGEPLDIEPCVAWCLHRSDCQDAGATTTDCETLCNPSYAGTPESCHDEVDDIFACAGALECAEETDFDIDDPDGPCGEAIVAYRTCVGG